MNLSLWELAATPLSEGQTAEAVSEPSNQPFEKWLKARLRQRKLAQPNFLRDAANGEYLNAAIQTLYETWQAEHASG